MIVRRDGGKRFTDGSGQGWCLSSSSQSLVRIALWLVVGPFMAVSSLPVFVFGVSVLAVAAQVLTVVLRHLRA